MQAKEKQEDNVSTASSCDTNTSKKIKSIEDILHNDKVRYQQKGYGLIVSILLFLSYFYFAPIVMKKIWPTIISLGEQKHVQFALTFILPQVFLLISNLMFWWIYRSKIPFFERYRIWDKQWPWEKDYAKWRQDLKKVIKQILFNQFCVLLPAMWNDIYNMGATKCKWTMEDFPDYQEILAQIVFMMVVEDFAFYWAHRFLHTPFLYKRIHKIHHEFVNSVSIAATYAHPIEYLLGNTVPTALGFMILGKKCHYVTYMIWIFIRMLETVDGHCGYEFSWSPYRLLPLSGSSEYHNYHHSHNVGTFGSFFTFWDTVLGTNKDYFEYKAKKEREQYLNKQLRKQLNENKKEN